MLNYVLMTLFAQDDLHRLGGLADWAVPWGHDSW